MPRKKMPNLWEPWNLPEDQAGDIGFQAKEDFELLESAVESLYGDFKDLSKKPKEPLTPLALETINSTIRDAKELMAGDRYVDRIGEFVAAGESPPNSDAMLVLGQLKAALARFNSTWLRTWRELDL